MSALRRMAWLVLVAASLPRAASANEIVAASGGAAHSLALDACGGVWAWGNNVLGHLGDGTRINRAVPGRVSGLATGVIAVSASGSSYALLAGGTVMAWGPNLLGQLGLGAISNDEILPKPIPSLAGVTAISAGGSHALAVVGGEVWAWGTNNEGQLGIGSLDAAAHPTPVKVPGLPAGIVAIAASRNNASYALDGAGFVWAWGRNTVGQAGRSTGGLPQLTAARVLTSSGAFLTDVVAIAASNAGPLVIRKDGTVWTWGFNSNGQLGDGTLDNRAFAAPVTLASGGILGDAVDAVSITGGTFYLLASLADGTAVGWGQNANGQLGDGTTLDRRRAVPVRTSGGAPLTGVAAIVAGGSHVHAVMRDRSLLSWGSRGVGQLGDGTIAPFQPNPVAVRDSADPATGSLIGASAIFAGGSASAAVLGTGTRAWGANGFGQLGDGATENRLTPVAIANLTGATSFSLGGSHTLALRPDGTVQAWGLGTNGQLGNGLGPDGVPLSSSVPVTVLGLTGVTAVSAAGNRGMALKSDGTVWGWGFNSTGQLGDGTTTARPVPVQTKQGAGFLTGVSAISASGAFSLALKTDGTVWAWGQNNTGQVGDGTTAGSRTTAVQVMTATGPLTGVTDIFAGGFFSVALRDDGTVWAWGQNNLGQLGNGTPTDSRVAVPVPGVSGAVSVKAGGNWALALLGGGTVRSWGNNVQGQLGDGTTINRFLPVTVMKDASEPFGGVAAIFAGGGHALARKADGSVWSFGANDAGQLGDGSDPNRVFPFAVTFPARQPPEATAAATPSVLSPPNHKMVPVRITVTAGDFCTGAPAVELASATSNEAENGADDGNTSSDIGASSRSGDTFTILLRAERSGSGGGRVYTLTFAITDAAGNQSTVDATVRVD